VERDDILGGSTDGVAAVVVVVVAAAAAVAEKLDIPANVSAFVIFAFSG